MVTVTVANQKGGVGKTTTAHILSAGLAGRGLRVLAVDVDPQTNLTFSSGIDLSGDCLSLYDLLKKKGSSAEAVMPSEGGFSIIPGSLDLAGADMEFTLTGREYMLREILEPLDGEFDFCVIDTPPTLGILTVNALTASQKVIVPMCADIYSFQGLSQLQGLIGNVRKYCNPALQVDGLLLTRYNAKAVINRQLKESLIGIAASLNTKVYSTTIREAVAIKESQLLQSDIFSAQPKSNVTKDYNAFIDEFLGGNML